MPQDLTAFGLKFEIILDKSNLRHWQLLTCMFSVQNTLVLVVRCWFTPKLFPALK